MLTLPRRAALCAVLVTWSAAAVASTGEVSAAAADVDAAIAAAATAPLDPNAALNAGVLLARADRLGEAAYYLERARALAPLDRDAEDALTQLHGEARRRRAQATSGSSFTEGEPEAVKRWRLFAGVSTDVLAVSLAVGVWAWFGALLARRRVTKPAVRDALAVVASVGALTAAIAGAGWWGRAIATRVRPAVVIAADPRLRDAPDELSRARRDPNLYEAAVVVVREDRGDWRRVELVDGAQVWVTAEALGELTDVAR
ncbi:MAG: hypothetical protein H6698_00155 [Myxococcales bacterium]|nr:hypothetical protein [Myxococcales bacterium]MCB9532723.1 hypothetical protein [Myxococcales bacterium]